MPDNDTNRTVSVDYTLAAAKTFSQIPGNRAEKFRFIYCSGAAAERDQSLVHARLPTDSSTFLTPISSDIHGSCSTLTRAYRAR